MNNFMEKLLNAFDEARIKEKETYDKIINEYNRNDEEWTIINEFLEEKILELAAKPFTDYDANDNSLIFYSTLCSPGYCYAYVYNLNDNTGFEIKSNMEKGDIVVPMINGIQVNDNKE